MIKNLLSNISSIIKNKVGKDSDFKEIARGGSTAFVINLAGLLIGYLFVLLVSKIYGNSSAQVYGQYVLISLLIRIGSIITRLGTDTAMLQQTAGLASIGLWKNIKVINTKLIRINCVTGFIVLLLLAMFYNLWAKLFKVNSVDVLISGILIVPMALGLFYSQSLRGLKKIGISSFLQNSSLPILNFFFLLMVLPFIKSGNKLFKDMPLISFYLSIIVTMALGIYYWRKYFPLKKFPDAQFEPSRNKSYKDLLKLSYPLLLAESMIFIIVWVNQLMLGFLGTPKDVGIFNLCVKYAMLAAMPLKAVTTIGAPKFSEFYFKQDRQGLKNIVVRTTKIIFWMSIPVVIFYLVFPGFLLNIFGNSFSVGTTALMLLSLGSLVNVMTGDTGTLLQMTGKQVVLQNILIVSLVFNVTVNSILIPRYGITGAAITSFLCSCINNFSMTWYIKREFGFYGIYFPFLFNSKFKFKTKTSMQ
jgi:O-antigen/teichoic acid export membrane protein